MGLNKRVTITLLLATILAVFASGYSTISGRSAGAEEDLKQLQAMASSQSYETLIRSVQSNPASREGFRFIVMGDSRGNMEIAQKVFRQAALEKPVFVLHTGDVVDYGTVREYLDYYLPLVKQVAPLPIIPVPGNHDAGPGKDFAGFKTIYGSDCFSFEYGDSRIIGVNNSFPDRLSADDLRFLDRELSKPGTIMKYVAMHIPPLFVEQGMKKCPQGTEYRGFNRNADAFHELMKRHHVRAVFFGHDHGFAAAVIDGVNYVISAGGGAKLYTNMCWIEAFHHYIVVHVSPDGARQELVRMDNGRWVRSWL